MRTKRGLSAVFFLLLLVSCENRQTSFSSDASRVWLREEILEVSLLGGREELRSLYPKNIHLEHTLTPGPGGETHHYTLSVHSDSLEPISWLVEDDLGRVGDRTVSPEGETVFLFSNLHRGSQHTFQLQAFILRKSDNLQDYILFRRLTLQIP